MDPDGNIIPLVEDDQGEGIKDPLDDLLEVYGKAASKETTPKKKSFVEALTNFLADTDGMTTEDVKEGLRQEGVNVEAQLERIERLIRKVKKQARRANK